MQESVVWTLTNIMLQSVFAHTSSQSKAVVLSAECALLSKTSQHIRLFPTIQSQIFVLGLWVEALLVARIAVACPL